MRSTCFNTAINCNNQNSCTCKLFNSRFVSINFRFTFSSAFGLFNKFVNKHDLVMWLQGTTLRCTLSPPFRELRGGTSEYTAGGVKRVPQLPFLCPQSCLTSVTFRFKVVCSKKAFTPINRRSRLISLSGLLPPTCWLRSSLVSPLNFEITSLTARTSLTSTSIRLVLLVFRVEYKP